MKLLTCIFSSSLIIIILMISHGCDDSDPTTQDYCYYKGITETDPSGRILSNDPDDWCFPDPESEDPHQFYLIPAYPNPAYPSTEIKFSLPDSVRVKMHLISTSCEKVRVLIDEELEKGPHSINWDGKDDYGNDLESGIYRCFFIADTFKCHGDIKLQQ